MSRSLRVVLVILALGLIPLASCGLRGGTESTQTAPAVKSSERVAEETRAMPPMAAPPQCRAFEPTQEHPELSLRDGQTAAAAWICPDETSFETLIESRDRVEPPETRTPKTFKDPLKAQTGMAIYDHALRQTGKLAWFVPILFNGTPPMRQAQIDFLDTHKRQAGEFVDVWQTEGGGTPEPYSWVGGMRWRKLEPLLKRYKRQKSRVRALLLREGGVLFVEDARAASDIYRFMSVSNLFDEEEVWHRRGDAIHKIRRKNRRTYTFAEGPRAGQRVRLLIFDRLALTREGVESRLGWDLLRLRPELALKAFRVEDHSPDLLRGMAVLRGEGSLRAAAFEVGGELRVAVIVAPDAHTETMAMINADRAGSAIKQGILKAGEQMLAEELRFDEPMTEEGQQDGHLRPTWLDAYTRGLHSYRYNGDRYTVFTPEGQPNVPQVCIDFIYDTVERWSGHWWAPKDETRVRKEGFIEALSWIGAREKRQVSQLVKSAEAHPDMMDLMSWSERERIPYAKQSAFYGLLGELSATTLPGDVFAIHGLKLDGRNHWHSFMIYDLDPIYNTPWLVIGNTGFVRIQPWHAIMRTGPARSITARIRWREDWLESQRRNHKQGTEHTKKD